MKPIVKLRIAMECADDEWRAALRHAAKAPTPEERTDFDIKAENLLQRLRTARMAYFDAIKQAAAEQEQHDPEGIQNHPRAAEAFNS